MSMLSTLVYNKELKLNCDNSHVTIAALDGEQIYRFGVAANDINCKIFGNLGKGLSVAIERHGFVIITTSGIIRVTWIYPASFWIEKSHGFVYESWELKNGLIRVGTKWYHLINKVDEETATGWWWK